MLPVPGSKVRHFREKIIQVLCVLGVFRAYVLKIQVLRVLGLLRACVLPNTASTHSISRFSTADTSGHAVFRGSILAVHTPCTSKHFRVSVLRVLHVLAAFRQLVLRALGILYMRSMYTRSKKYNSTICAPTR